MRPKMSVTAKFRRLGRPGHSSFCFPSSRFSSLYSPRSSFSLNHCIIILSPSRLLQLHNFLHHHGLVHRISGRLRHSEQGLSPLSKVAMGETGQKVGVVSVMVTHMLLRLTTCTRCVCVTTLTHDPPSPCLPLATTHSTTVHHQVLQRKSLSAVRTT